jgi:hypothetical protein
MTNSPRDRVLLCVPLPTVRVGNSLVVLDPVREQAHLLNATAGCVWERFTEPTAVEDATEQIAELYNIDAATIAHDVLGSIDELTRAGLLSDGPGFEVPSPEQTATSGCVDHPLPEVDPPLDLEQARYRALSTEFTIEADNREVAAFLGQALDSLRCDMGEGAEVETQALSIPSRWTYALESEGDQIAVSMRGIKAPITVAPVADAVSTVMWHYNSEAIARTDDRVLLHASAVAGPTGALILPAVSNSGKSTLATALVRAGLRYITDEAVAIDPASSLVHPYPKPIGLDPGSFPLFPELAPPDDGLMALVRPHKWWLDPRVVSPHGSDGVVLHPVPVAAVVFPTYDPATAPCLTPMSPDRALLQLTHNAFNLRKWGQTGLDVLAGLARSVDSWSLTHNDIDQALTTLIPLVSGPPMPTNSPTGPATQHADSPVVR